METQNIASQNQALQGISQKLEDIIKTDMVWDNIVSLSGAAGTGKTYLTTKLVKQLEQNYHITITAPTHKALQVLRKNLSNDDIENVNTKTLQSFLNIRLVTNFDNGVQKFEPLKTKEKDNTKTDILIVDESSMVSTDLYEYIIKAIEQQRIKAVLFVGDEYQLLPVDEMDVKVFDIKTKYKLEKIVRQVKDSYIIKMATKARNIIKSKKYISLQEFLKDDLFSDKIQFFATEKEFHDDFCTPETWAKQDKIVASFTNSSVEYHNRIIRDRYWKAQGEQNPLVLLKGDKVIFQETNIIDKKIIHQNSDIVELSYATKVHQESLQIDFWDCKDLTNRPFKVIDPESKERFKMILNKLASSAKIEKNYAERTKKWKLFYDIKELFVDVKYTYASTIHKLQGSTYESVYIDLRQIENMSNKDMLFRLLYVAITRASSTVKILLPNGTDISLVHYQNNILNSIDSQFKNIGFEL